MDAMTSQLLHILFVVCAAILAFALITALTAGPFIRWTARFTPQDRLSLLKFYAAIPLLGGIVVGVMTALPSLSHAMNFAVDHCHDINGCWWLEAPHEMSLDQILVISLIAASGFRAGFTAFEQWQRSRRLGTQIELSSSGSTGLGIRLIDSNRVIAFSTGLLKPFAVISTGMVRNLTTDQLAIVCLHEQLHTDNRDNWHKWSFNLLGMFHWAGVRRALLTEYALSLELRVDEQVAEQVDNRIAVAETIVAVQRLTQGDKDQQRFPVSHFAGSSTERRVHHLLSVDRFSILPRRLLSSVYVSGVVSAIGAALLFHDVFEALII